MVCLDRFDIFCRWVTVSLFFRRRQMRRNSKRNNIEIGPDAQNTPDRNPAPPQRRVNRALTRTQTTTAVEDPPGSLGSVAQGARVEQAMRLAPNDRARYANRVTHLTRKRRSRTRATTGSPPRIQHLICHALPRELIGPPFLHARVAGTTVGFPNVCHKTDGQGRNSPG